MNAIPFPTTRRSVIVALTSDDSGERTRALDTLVALYWRPLYKYARVAWNRTREDAEDLTQSFFARVVEKDSLASYDVAKASFRTFLRLLFDRHISNEKKSGERLKRGGGEVHLDFEAAEAELGRESARGDSPEEYFRREWIRSVFALAVERLHEWCEASGRSVHYKLFDAYDLDEDRTISYRELGSRFGITETTVTNYLATTRRELRRIVLDTLREVTASDHEFRAEARALLGVDPP